MSEAGDENLRITVRGLLIATAIAAIFIMACMVPLDGQWMDGVTALYAVRLTSFFAALAAPFERALAGMYVGLGFFVVWVIGSLLVSLAVLACSPKPDPCVMRVSSAPLGKENLDEAEATRSGADHQEAA